MVEQHEQQHVETMLATHQLRAGEPLLGPGAPLPPWRPVPRDSVLIPAGEFVLGVDGADEPWSLDNERPAHVVDQPAFRIGRFPVTNAEWQRFIDDGGYDEPRWWSSRGWAHRIAVDLRRPEFWSVDGSRRRFGIVEEIPPDEPVQHVCFFEAEAYAAWAGARLPTEQEWEKACVWDPALGRRRRWPWGSSDPTPPLTNLGGEALRPAPVGAYPAGASPYGVEQLMGDVWEWTSSAFEPWPGFTPMLYRQYSAPFFGGDYRVLRGGSWAVGGASIRPSFRNWDLPIRRQIFCGVRLAWDAADV
jgi:iron(II)-dependent oxidoreductase